MLPALPAMPRKLIDRSMDRAFRRGGTLRGWEERRGTEGTKEPLGWRNNCSGEGALAGWGVAAAAAAEEIGAGLGRVGCGGGETGQAGLARWRRVESGARKVAGFAQRDDVAAHVPVSFQN
jgi:hypothetical protein